VAAIPLLQPVMTATFLSLLTRVSFIHD
jgi:hypothetical protein